MLRNIYIKSFRSCHELSIENIDELTILVGRNGVGKSNILKAISWCAKIATSSSSNLNYGVQPFNIKIQVELDGDIYIYSVDGRVRDFEENAVWSLCEELHINRDGHPSFIFNKNGSKLKFDNFENDFEVGSSASALFSIFNLAPNNIWNENLKKFFDFLAAVKYYPLTEVEDAEENYNNVFITQEQFNKWLITRSADNSSKVVLAKILDFYLNKNDKFEELLNLLGKQGIGLISDIEITAINVPKSAVGEKTLTAEAVKDKTKIYFVSFKPVMNDGEEGFRFDSLSFGTKRLIRFVTDFLYDDATVSLVEQPEDGVHCGLLYKLFDLLDSYSEDRQTIVASHSADLLNRAKPKDIRLVEMNAGATIVRELSGKEQFAANEFKKNNGTLSEFLRSLQE